MNYDKIKNLIPKVSGKVRKESWGGLYYIRDSMTLEMINETTFDLIKLIDGKNTIADMVDIMCKEYDVNRSYLINDLLKYFKYAINNNYIFFDDINLKEENEQQFSIEKYGQFDEKKDIFILGMKPYVLSAPFKVLLELTYNCNLKCVHCFADAKFCKKTPLGYIEGELNTKQWIKVIDNIADAGVFSIFVSGGEALMRKDLFDILEHISFRKIDYILLSNTTLITDEIAKKLKETGCMKVESNLDGYDDVSYDSFRGVKGSYKATVKGIKACLKNNIPLRCNVVETKKNIYNLKKIVDTANKIGVNELCVVPLELGGRAKKNMEELAFNEQEAKELSKFYKEVEKWCSRKYGEEFLLVTPQNFYKDSDSRYKKVINITNHMPTCGAGKIHCTVDPYGNLKLCPTDRDLFEFENTNLLQKNLKDIWKESKVLDKIRSYNFKSCQRCSRENCSFACPVTRYYKTGKLELNKDKMCNHL